MAEIGEPDHVVRRERTPVPSHAPQEPVTAPVTEPVPA
jgi:hypothetical protein